MVHIRAALCFTNKEMLNFLVHQYQSIKEQTDITLACSNQASVKSYGIWPLTLSVQDQSFHLAFSLSPLKPHTLVDWHTDVTIDSLEGHCLWFLLQQKRFCCSIMNLFLKYCSFFVWSLYDYFLQNITLFLKCCDIFLVISDIMSFFPQYIITSFLKY